MLYDERELNHSNFRRRSNLLYLYFIWMRDVYY